VHARSNSALRPSYNLAYKTLPTRQQSSQKWNVGLLNLPTLFYLFQLVEMEYNYLLPGTLNTILILGSTIAVLTVLILVIQFCVKTFVFEGKQWESKYASELVRHLIIGVTVLVVSVRNFLEVMGQWYGIITYYSQHRSLISICICTLTLTS